MFRGAPLSVRILSLLVGLWLLLAACNGGSGNGQGGGKPTSTSTSSGFYRLDNKCPQSWDGNSPTASAPIDNMAADQTLNKRLTWSLKPAQGQAMCLHIRLNETTYDAFFEPSDSSISGLIVVAPPSDAYVAQHITWQVFGKGAPHPSLDACRFDLRSDSETLVELVLSHNTGPLLHEGKLSILKDYCTTEQSATPTPARIGFNPTLDSCPQRWSLYTGSMDQASPEEIEILNAGGWISIKPEIVDSRGLQLGPGAVCLISVDKKGDTVSQMFEPASTLQALLLVTAVKQSLKALTWYVYGGGSSVEHAEICSSGTPGSTPITLAGPDPYGGMGFGYGTLNDFCAHHKGA